MLREPGIISFFLSALFFSACIRQITPPIRQSAPILVVEGMITTDPSPYTVKLSYTGRFTNASVRIDSNQNFINDALVVIKDSDGDSSSCILTSPGTYQSTDSNFVGIVGHTYTLKIFLSNGKTYVSKPERIIPVPPIDSITVIYDSTYITDVRPTRLIVSVNTPDPPDMQNYYRWTASGYVPRKSWGSPCSIFSPPCTDAFSCTCHAFCVQSIENKQINILSDKLINAKEIIQPVFYSPLYSQGKHFIEIKQYSLDPDIYLFWQQYLDQTSRTGSILDPLPAPLTSNIYNENDTNDIALGYFGCSAITTKKVIIVPFFLQVYYLLSVAGEYVSMGDCNQDYPNSLADDTDPSGWGNAEIIEMH